MSALVEIGALASCQKVGDSPACAKACDGCRAHLAASLTAIEKAGYRIVPVEPTREMLAEGAYDPWDGANEMIASIVWERMLAAAPKVI